MASFGKEACLWIRGLSRLSKYLGLKKHPNTLKKEEWKETKEFMKVEKWGVHHNIYNGCCMKQWIKIPKIIWTSPILRKRLTCRTSFNNAFLKIKNDVNDEVPNGTFKILILFYGLLNWNGVLKLGGKPKGDHGTHSWGWIKRPITWSLVWKCSYVDDNFEGVPWCECHLQCMKINKRENG